MERARNIQETQSENSEGDERPVEAWEKKMVEIREEREK